MFVFGRWRGHAIPPLTVAEGVAEMGLKGIGKLVSVQDKSIKDGAAEIGNSMLSLDSIELMGSVKKFLTKTISTEDLLLKLKHKMDTHGLVLGSHGR